MAVFCFDENKAVPHIGDPGTATDHAAFTAPLFEAVSAGFGAYADNHVIDRIPVYVSSRQEAAETICIRVSGNSMFPKIEDGDIIQVHKQTSVDSGNVAVVMLDGESFLVKRIVYDKNSIMLQSFNPEYEPRFFKGQDVLRVAVVGKVTKIIKSL